MVTEKLKELEATRAKLASLEQAVAAELNKELAALPSKYGFASVDDFARAVLAAGGGGGSASRATTRVKGRRGRPPGRPSAAASGAAAKPAGGRKRRKRSVITDETRAEVKRLVAAGKTGGEIASTLGISLPSVQNIKKALGLVKNR
jgi:DNA-binding CsgD family transcriptional regulator